MRVFNSGGCRFRLFVAIGSPVSKIGASIVSLGRKRGKGDYLVPEVDNILRGTSLVLTGKTDAARNHLYAARCIDAVSVPAAESAVGSEAMAGASLAGNTTRL